MTTESKGLRLTLRALSFVLIFIVLYLALSVVFTPKRDDEPEGMSNNIIYPYRGEEKNTIDVLFIGNSDVARGINPAQIWRDFRITSCTVGPPAVNHKTVFRYIEDACRYQQPKVIVLEVDCLFGAKNKYYDLINEEYAKKKPAPETLGGRLDTLEEQIVSGLAFYWPIMKYHARWQELCAEDFTNPNGRYKYSAKGYMYSDEITPFSYGEEYMSEVTDSASQISDEKYANIMRIVNFCSDRGIGLAFLAVPSGSSWSVKKHNAISALAKSLGIDFADYNSNPELLDGFDWSTDTKDGGNHMNCFGAEKVTAAYTKHMIELFGLEPSALNEKQAAQWDRDAEIFYTEIARNN